MSLDRVENMKITSIAISQNNACLFQKEFRELNIDNRPVFGEEDLEKFSETWRIRIQRCLGIAKRFQQEIHRHQTILQSLLFAETEQSEFTDQILCCMCFA